MDSGDGIDGTAGCDERSRPAWHLPSNGGYAELRATLDDAGPSQPPVQRWTLVLTRSHPYEDHPVGDTRCEFRGVALSRTSLETLRGLLGKWLAQPLAIVASRPFVAAVELSADADCDLTLAFDDSPALILGPGHARCALTIRRVSTIVSEQFVVDPSCLQELHDGLTVSLRGQPDA